MPIESYNLVYKRQTEKAVCFKRDESGDIWLPKSQIEVDGVSCEDDFDNLVIDEELDVYIPDWLAEDKNLL